MPRQPMRPPRRAPLFLAIVIAALTAPAPLAAAALVAEAPSDDARPGRDALVAPRSHSHGNESEDMLTPLPLNTPLFIPGNDFALLTWDPATWEFLVTDTAKPLGRIDLLVVTLGDKGFDPWFYGLYLQTPEGDRLHEFDGVEAEDAILIPDLPAVEGAAFTVSLVTRDGQIVRSTGPVALAAPEPIPDLTPRQAFADGPRTSAATGSCIRGYTSAWNTGNAGAIGVNTNAYNTAAIALGKDEIRSDWAYRTTYYGSSTPGPTTNVPNAFRFGHGWYGANVYRYGNEFNIGGAAGIVGSRNAENVNTGAGCGFVTVGHIVTLSKPQVFYFDVSSGVVAQHKDAWEKQRPSTSCSTVIPTVLKSALALTKSGGWLNVVIPNKFCTASWTKITSANGRSGMGIEATRSSTGTYEGSDAYIKTHYSSTGNFYMHFGGFVYFNGFFNGCQSCTAHNLAGWYGFDGASGGPWSVGRVTT